MKDTWKSVQVGYVTGPARARGGLVVALRDDGSVVWYEDGLLGRDRDPVSLWPNGDMLTRDDVKETRQETKRILASGDLTAFPREG
jgi:hypothetical protein